MISTCRRRIWVVAAIPVVGFFASACGALHGQDVAVPQADTATIDADGTAHITRVIPVPQTLSPEAQKYLAHLPPLPSAPTLADHRANTDRDRIQRTDLARKLYPVGIHTEMLGGVRCDIIQPRNVAKGQRPLVLINVHGGGFNSDSGSLLEGIPIAYLSGITVVSVYYRLAPEYPFPAAVDDTEAVFKELMKTHKPAQMGLYGTSAGAILTGEVAARLRRDGLPLPGVLGIFSGTGDMSRSGDSAAFFTVRGLAGNLRPPRPGPLLSPYVGSTDPRDPVLSPIFADLRGFPPSLLVTSTRDILLSGTTDLHRALLRAGVNAQLVVFDGLPHAFWYHLDLPETKEALDIMARFFDKQLGVR